MFYSHRHWRFVDTPEALHAALNVAGPVFFVTVLEERNPLDIPEATAWISTHLKLRPIGWRVVVPDSVAATPGARNLFSVSDSTVTKLPWN